MKGIITNIKRNSLDDGPGIRTLIFFKGCPLSCIWCQNPETQSINQEISYDNERCLNCKRCKKICTKNAVDLNKVYPIDTLRCNFCGDCIKVCQGGSLKFTAYKYSIEELIEEIQKDKVFFDNSGGGVTLSGGEATVQMDFASRLIIELSKLKINVCIETCGYFNYKRFSNLILPYLDLIYYDLKIFDSELHKKYCGIPNEKILQNFESLILEENIEVLPRIPLIPKITTNEENLISLMNYLKNLNINRIELLPYNPLWISKLKSLGRSNKFEHSEWLTLDEKRRIKEIFRNFKFREF